MTASVIIQPECSAQRGIALPEFGLRISTKNIVAFLSENFHKIISRTWNNSQVPSVHHLRIVTPTLWLKIATQNIVAIFSEKCCRFIYLFWKLNWRQGHSLLSLALPSQEKTKCHRDIWLECQIVVLAFLGYGLISKTLLLIITTQK